MKYKMQQLQNTPMQYHIGSCLSAVVFPRLYNEWADGVLVMSQRKQRYSHFTFIFPLFYSDPFYLLLVQLLTARRYA